MNIVTTDQVGLRRLAFDPFLMRRLDDNVGLHKPTCRHFPALSARRTERAISAVGCHLRCSVFIQEDYTHHHILLSRHLQVKPV